MRNLIRLLRGKPVELSPKQEEKMAKIRAKAEAQIAEREAEGAKARAEYEAFMASQGLPVQPAPAAPTSMRDAFQQVQERLPGAGRVARSTTAARSSTPARTPT